MAKHTVYSWRLSTGRKAALEHVAREQSLTVSGLLDQAVDQWLQSRSAVDAEDTQERLHRAAQPFIGAISGGDPHRSTAVRRHVRESLRRRRARS